MQRTTELCDWLSLGHTFHFQNPGVESSSLEAQGSPNENWVLSGDATWQGEATMLTTGTLLLYNKEERLSCVRVSPLSCLAKQSTTRGNLRNGI